MIDLFGTILIFLIYLAIRWRYFKLPIGPDTGYYVSNNTIVNSKFAFSKGWNARYALCSKFLPEAFCSLIYVWFGHKKYKFLWRLFFSIYNFATASAVGGIVHLLTNGAPFSYLAGLLTFSLVSSETDYGIYYESAEQFEILFQAWGTLLILKGLQPIQPELLVLGSGFWFFDIFFVKITAIAAAAPLVLGSVIYSPGILKYILIEFALFLFLYVLLFLISNKNPLATFKSEVAHQSTYSRGGRKNVSVVRGYLEKLERKARQSFQMITSNPIIPFLAIIGTFWVSKHANHLHVVFLLLYVLGVSMKLLISFLPIWWYTIPILPLVGAFGALGAFEVLDAGPYGMLVLTVLALMWLTLYSYRVLRKDAKGFVMSAWRMHPIMGQLHWDLEQTVAELEGIVNEGSLFVYGYPSLCPMVGRSYDVNFLTGIKYMDELNPTWQIELHEKMLETPPSYIFDMFGRFDFNAVKDNLGLHYETIRAWNGLFPQGVYRLFRLVKRNELQAHNVNFHSYQSVETGYV